MEDWDKVVTRLLTIARRAGIADAPPGPLVSDAFDRADSNTSLGTADTGQAWTTISGTVGISSNKAYVPGGSGVVHLDSGASDADITVDITHSAGNDTGVIFRSLDANNYMMARLGANKVELYRKQAGAWTLIADVAMTLTVGQVYAFRVVAFGSTIDVYVDGVKKITATDGFQSTLTKHGLYGNDGNARWDNFKVEAADPPLAYDTFNRADSTTTLGTADTGQAWNHVSDKWGITTNKAYVSSPGSETWAQLESGAADVDITCDIQHAANNGLVFRYVDDSNLLMARFGVDTVQLYRRQAGAWTLVSSVAMTLTAGQTYAFRVVASGSTIKVYVDGVEKITATESFQSTATKHGLYGVENNSRWDNFKVGAADPLLVKDSFDRADSATSLGMADTGQAWTALAGTWGIETNEAYSPDTTPADRQAAVESGAADVKVAVDLAVYDDGAGLLFRGVDANNYWIFVAEGIQWTLWKRVAGTYTTVGSHGETSFAGRMEVVCSGATITCKVDGVTKVTATDTAHETATRHGLRDHESGSLSAARFDNFRVETT